MRKTLTLLLLFTLSLAATESKAQLTNGSFAPDFNYPDLNGNNQHLYALLDSGYTVFTTTIATWCAPNWNYHNTGNLQSLYNLYGPAGTNELRVLYIESDGTTPDAELYGTGTNTQGDYVTGTPFPIINLSLSDAANYNTNFNIVYYPTIYMICPDRTVTEVGQPTTSQLYADKAACAMATMPYDAKVLLNLTSSPFTCDSVTTSYTVINMGTTALTSATITIAVDGINQYVNNWTGSLGTYQSTIISGIHVGSAVSGTHTITATIANPNGNVDGNLANNTVTHSFVKYGSSGSTVVENFETGTIPAMWDIQNGGDQNTTWSIANTGYLSSKSVILPFYNIAGSDIDAFVIDPVSFAGNTSPSVSFDYAYATYNSSYSDQLDIQASTDCGQTWTTYFSQAGASLATAPSTTISFVPTNTDWVHQTVNFSGLAGQSFVLIRFKGTSGYSNNLYIDNINTIPPAITVNVDCYGNNSGSITLPPLGSHYSNNGGVTYQSSNVFTGLAAGTYSIIIADASFNAIYTQNVTITQPAALTIDFTNTTTTVCGGNTGSISTNVSGGTSPINYSWSNGDSGNYISNLTTGNYILTATDNNGCVLVSPSISIATEPLNSVPLCMVSVDSTSNHNIVVWEKTGLPSTIDSFRIYRETMTNVYTHIGSVSMDSLSEFHDYGANPNVTSYKYKIAVLDSCGSISPMSDYHNTIHLQYLGNGNLLWSLYGIENAANPVNFYIISRDDTGTGNFLPISSTIPGGNNSYTDVNYASYPNARYRVEVTWNISCNPTRTVTTTHSNVIHLGTSVSVSELEQNNAVSISPNPTSDEFRIKHSFLKITRVNIYNVMGEEVLTQEGIASNELEMDVTNLKTGMYFAEVTTEQGSIRKKVIKK